MLDFCSLQAENGRLDTEPAVREGPASEIGTTEVWAVFTTVVPMQVLNEAG